MNNQEAIAVIDFYSGQLQSSRIEVKDLPSEYFIAMCFLIKEGQVKQQVNVSIDQKWTDFDEMVEDMAEHAKNNGRALICADLPQKLMLGWACQNTEKTWHIKLTDLRRCIDNTKNAEKRESLRASIVSQEGKVALTKMINNLK